MLGFLFLWIILVNVYAGAYENLSQVPNHLYPFGPQDDQNPVDVSYFHMSGPHMRQILPKKRPMMFLGLKVIEIMEEEEGGIMLYDVIHQIKYDGFHAPIFHHVSVHDAGKVFPFSSEINLNMGGHITYRFVKKKTDRRLLKRATRDVKKAFPCNDDFKASNVIIVTWYNVNFFQDKWEWNWYSYGLYCDFYVTDYCCGEGWKHYGYFCSGEYKRSAEIDHPNVVERREQVGQRERKTREAEFEDNRQNVDDIDTSLGLNTFQTVFIYNKSQTYVMFNYGEINWIREEELLYPRYKNGTIASAFIEFRDINYTLPVSGTEEIRNIEENTNCGVPGRYMFRVDSATGVKMPSHC